MSEQLDFEDEEVSITLRRAWDRALRLLASRVNKPTFETHIRAIKPCSLSELTEAAGRQVYEIALGVPSAFTREWVEKRHSALITSVLEEILDRDVRLRFTLLPRDKSGGGTGGGTPSLSITAPPIAAVREALAAGPLSAASAEDGDSAKALTVSRPQAPEPARTAKSSTPRYTEAVSDTAPLNARYTFDSFVIGPTNRLAEAGARAVADAPGQVYNPLFIYGPPGMGKTHLMHAIGNVLASGTSEVRVAYVSGESFTTGYITSVRERRTEEFRRRWRTVDVWLVDDVQFIAGKEHTKEEFFHTFNTLYQSGKQIVISSDRSPRELRMMDERLRSRFECGLIADIAPPDLETRLAILQRKAELERTRIPDDVLLYMARLVRSNIRNSEGALVRLVAYASLVNSPVTTELASSVLERYYIAAGFGNETADGDAADAPGAAAKRLAARTAKGLGGANPITADLVQRVVAKQFGLAPEILSGRRRDREAVAARQIAMHLLRDLTEMSLPGIGQNFGGRDHKTVAYACDKVRGMIPVDAELRKLVDDLTVQVRAQSLQ